MSANGYLTRLAGAAVLRDTEQLSVHGSLAALKVRLDTYFNGTLLSGNMLKRHFAFGSFTRGTILPHAMDEHSDIDYMVVFAEEDATPQTYLNRLLRFAEAKYPRSDIAQSNPTIVLSLNRIKFELVPAIDSFFGGLKIPLRSNGYQTWQDTEPNAFNEKLTEKNKSNGNLIKPLARVLKYWNACNGYPYESYLLERSVVDHSPPLTVILFGEKVDLWAWFSSFIEDMSVSWGEPNYKKRAVERAQSLVSEIKAHESRGEDDQAQRKLERLLPPIA
ncbi:MAG: hypothetical protein K9M98_02705 [Cephaloticoccus sp.]|nr:hypothetical protein [Cephaloticoccus sp.]MCF7759391.1 hypothetical protein [Cephaloticoccus sp.]